MHGDQHVKKSNTHQKIVSEQKNLREFGKKKVYWRTPEQEMISWAKVKDAFKKKIKMKSKKNLVKHIYALF